MSLRCHEGRGAGVTGSTRAHRRREISEDRAANHSRSAGSHRTVGESCLRSTVFSCCSTSNSAHPLPRVGVAAPWGPTAVSVPPDTPVRRTFGQGSRRASRCTRPTLSSGDEFPNGHRVTCSSCTGVRPYRPSPEPACGSVGRVGPGCWRDAPVASGGLVGQRLRSTGISPGRRGAGWIPQVDWEHGVAGASCGLPGSACRMCGVRPLAGRRQGRSRWRSCGPR